MDHAFADVTELAAIWGPRCPGRVRSSLIGQQHGAAISAEDAAARLETNNYEVASRLMARLPRIAINS